MVERTLDKAPAPRVLVVDDNQEISALIRTHLVSQYLGVSVAHTAAEAESLFCVGRFDAIIVDLLLPDRTGHRLIAALAKRGALPPVFVITGVFRGSAAEAQMNDVVPVAGWYEKPFDFRVLTQAVCRALGHEFTARTAPASPAVEQALRVYAAAQPVSRDDSGGAGAPRSGLSSTGLSGLRGADPFRDVRTGFGRSTTPSATDMAVGLRTELRVGDLRSVPAPRLIGAFHVARETGEVAFEDGPNRQIVYFDAGRPVFARSNRRKDRLAAVVAAKMKIDREEFRTASEAARARGQPLESLIVERGWIDRAGLKRAQQAQMRRLLLELFRWSDGQYTIRFRRREDLPRAELEEDTGALVLDGVRGQVALERLQDLLPDPVRLMPSPNAPFPLYALPIQDKEAAVLLKVTGSRTVRALIDQAPRGLDEHGVRALLYGLLVLGVLVSGRPPVRDGLEPELSASVG